MAERDRHPPGTWLVIALATVALAWTGWMRLGRVRLAPWPAAAATAGAGSWPDMRVDVNTATEAELCELPGIGPRLAERIVAERRRGGPFASPADLARVPGVGPRLVQRISGYAVAYDRPE